MDRSELEQHWKARWQEAKLNLEAARAQVESVKDLCIGPDGRYAYRSALAQETAALISYSKVLRIYTDLVVHGKLPDNNDAAGAKGSSSE